MFRIIVFGTMLFVGAFAEYSDYYSYSYGDSSNVTDDYIEPTPGYDDSYEDSNNTSDYTEPTPSYDDSYADSYYDYNDTEIEIRLAEKLFRLESEPIKTPTTKSRKFVKRYRKFATKIWQDLVTTTGLMANTVFSPLSIFSTLVTLRPATQGHSRRQIDKTLHIAGYNSSEVGYHLQKVFKSNNGSIYSANRVYYDQNVILSRKFRRDLFGLNFVNWKKVGFSSNPEEARRHINHYVREKTQHQINELLPIDVVTDLTKVYFVNAMYLKAEWDSSFDPKQTLVQSFTTYSKDEKVQVKMMSKRDSICKLRYFNDGQVVILPLNDRQMEMVFVVPDDKKSFENYFNQTMNARKSVRQIFRKIDKDVNTGWSNCDVSMPKFRISHTVSDMIESLKRLGITDVFDENAKLGRMFSHYKPYETSITDIQHQTVLEVDEYGIKGAAATAVQAATRSIPASVVINRPFHFIVREKSQNAMLFVGTITDPSQL